MELRKKSLLFLVVASILWSTGGLFIKLVDLNPFAIAGIRSGIAALIMMLYIRKPMVRLNKNMIVGGLSYTSLVFLFVTSTKLTTSANAILLQFTSAIWVALFSKWFLKENIKKRDWITIIIVILGMVLFFIGDLNSGNLLGNFLATLSGVAMAAMIICLKLEKHSDPINITIIGNLMAFVIGLPFCFLQIPNQSSLLGLLFLGVFQLGISYILFTKAIKHVSAVEAVLIPVLEPLLNPVWVILITGEAPSISALIGGIIVLTAVITNSLTFKNSTKIT